MDKVQEIVNAIIDAKGTMSNIGLRQTFGYGEGTIDGSFNKDMNVIKVALALHGIKLESKQIGNIHQYKIINTHELKKCKKIQIFNPFSDIEQKDIFVKGCQIALQNSLIGEQVLFFGNLVFGSKSDFLFFEIGDELKKCIMVENKDLFEEIDRIWLEVKKDDLLKKSSIN